MEHKSTAMDEDYAALLAAWGACQLMPSSMLARETYENLCCHLVARWHFTMLNDKGRNSAYKQAIEKVVGSRDSGITVCDIGCGTGLLSLIAAAQDKCSKVYAIESSIVMCNIVEEVKASPDVSQTDASKVTVVNKTSTDMSVPGDMLEKADVLVTEIFDAGLFGEGFLPTLSHAWNKLLKTGGPGEVKATVIPQGAALFVQAIQCDFIEQEHICNTSDYSFPCNGLTICSGVSMTGSEPYTTYDLKNVPGGYKALTDHHEVMDVNFDNIEEIDRLNAGVLGTETLQVVSDGRLDALVVWFNLRLCEGIDISTHPDVVGCWEQAVFPVSLFKLNEISSQNGRVKKGQTLLVQHKVKGGKLHMYVEDIEGDGCSPSGDGSSPSGDGVKTSGDGVKPSGHGLRPSGDGPETNSHFYQKNTSWSKQGVYCLNTSEISRLNDKKLYTVLQNSLRSCLVGCPTSSVCFIHLNNGFSPLCLEGLFEGCNPVVTVAKTRSVHEKLLDHIVRNTDVDREDIVTIDSLYDLLVSDRFAQTFALSYHSERNEGGNLSTSLNGSMRETEVPGVIVACDLVDVDGRLLEGLSEQFAIMRECLQNNPCVVALPASVEVHGVLVKSDALSRRSKVASDDSTLGIPVGGFLNKFSTRNHQGIPLSCLPHTKLCEPFKMFNIDLRRLLGAPEQPGPRVDGEPERKRPRSTSTEAETGDARATKGHKSDGGSEEETFDDPLNQMANIQVPITVSGDITALIYWFVLKFPSDISDPWSATAEPTQEENQHIPHTETTIQSSHLKSNISSETELTGSDGENCENLDRTYHGAPLSPDASPNCSPVAENGHSAEKDGLCDSDSDNLSESVQKSSGRKRVIAKPKGVEISTLDPTHHWQQAAVMMEDTDHKTVTAGQTLGLHCHLSHSAFRFSIGDKLEI